MRTKYLLFLSGLVLCCAGWKDRDATKTPPPVLPPPHPAKTAIEVADRLDTMLQPRFLERGEYFGVDRVYIPLNAHAYRQHRPDGTRTTQALYALIGRDSEEKTLLSEADAPQKDYVVGFIHGANTLGKPGDRKTGFDRIKEAPADRFEPLVMHDKKRPDSYIAYDGTLAAWLKDVLPTFDKSLVVSDAKARKGEKTTDTVGAWVLTLRPVKAQAACLGCHSLAKKGDTLGIMAYAVKN